MVHFIFYVAVEVVVESVGSLADFARNVRDKADRVAGIGCETVVVHLLLHHGHAYCKKAQI